MKKNSLIGVVLISVILYSLSASISYAFFYFIKSKERGSEMASPLATPPSDKKSRFQIASGLPRNVECPLNGVYYTQREKEIWEKRRPLAVMIENSTEARPQSGLSLADIVYEAVAEGGITRFMPIYFCGASLGNINLAPVRSTRTYFIDWVSEYDALYNHVGGAGRCNDDTVDDRAKALCQIQRYGIKDLDQFGIGYPDCFRNPDRLSHPVATEHQMVCLSDNLYRIAQERGWTDKDEDGVAWDKNFVAWKFKDDMNLEDRPQSFSVSFSFWDGYKDYDVRWEYDRESNTFRRFNGGVFQTDLETDQPIAAKNVVVQLTKELETGDIHKHLLYQTIGQGQVIVFQDGKAISGTWQKKNRLSRTIFYDDKGKEIKFNRGQIWIEIVPLGNKINY